MNDRESHQLSEFTRLAFRWWMREGYVLVCAECGRPLQGFWKPLILWCPNDYGHNLAQWIRTE